MLVNFETDIEGFVFLSFSFVFINYTIQNTRPEHLVQRHSITMTINNSEKNY